MAGRVVVLECSANYHNPGREIKIGYHVIREKDNEIFKVNR